jgi:hypothetical protein
MVTLLCFRDDLLIKKQREYSVVSDIVIDENQRVSAEHVRKSCAESMKASRRAHLKTYPLSSGSIPKAHAAWVRRQNLIGRAFWNSSARWASTDFRFRVESGCAAVHAPHTIVKWN